MMVTKRCKPAFAVLLVTLKAIFLMQVTPHNEKAYFTICICVNQLTYMG